MQHITMDQKTLIQRVESVLSEYKSLFGSDEHLNLSDDILVAQKELEVSKTSDSFCNNVLYCFMTRYLSYSHPFKLFQELEKRKEPLAVTQKEEELSTEQRLKAYDEFVSSEVERKEKDFSDLVLLDTSFKSDASNRTKSKLEILAEERDYKRRRQSYKGGKAGSLKRSYTEIIRDVIESQSEMLRQMKTETKKSKRDS
ncbi:U11/U12 small nuclear ribonucleoprotein 48 kDa protein-like isoform X1 [Watersipora subatra]|uniref:U11/U12 small nuclear ribonucleoprotein 48 kDa protein-like isoform X1 n=1 Tax=Watersipora subatra TaxID=2589382 RepID=UPI00355C0D2F